MKRIQSEKDLQQFTTQKQRHKTIQGETIRDTYCSVSRRCSWPTGWKSETNPVGVVLLNRLLPSEQLIQSELHCLKARFVPTLPDPSEVNRNLASGTHLGHHLKLRREQSLSLLSVEKGLNENFRWTSIGPSCLGCPYWARNQWWCLFNLPWVIFVTITR